jgi:putative ABC transport system permease protein
VIVTPFRDHLFGRVTVALPALFGATLCILFIGCTNLVNLQLVRAASRTQEIAVRLALGAGRRRIVRQLLLESLILFAIGGAVGLLTAYWGVELLRTLGADSIPRLKEAGIDAGTLLFAATLTTLTGVIVGLLPAMQSSKIDLNQALKNAGSGGATPARRLRTRGALAVSQFALATALVVAAGLLMKSFLNLQKTSPGFEAERVLIAGLSLSLGDYPNPAPRIQLFRQGLEQIRNLPEVEAAGGISFLPLGGRSFQIPFWIAGREQTTNQRSTLADFRGVTTGFFETVRAPIKHGRDFNEHDHAKAPLVAVVNETFARTYFDGADPIGQRFRLGLKDEPYIEIVGVAGDIKHRSIELDASPTIYVCDLQTASTHSFPILNYVVRAKTTPGAIADRVRRELQSLDPNQAVFNVRPMVSLLTEARAERRFTMLLLATLAALALTLAVVGVYGVMSWSVSQRTREIGLRMALGAQIGDVMWLIVRQGMKITLLGAALGLATAMALTRVIRSLLFNVSENDPYAFGCALGVMALAAALACYLPARRATRVDPMIAIRES